MPNYKPYSRESINFPALHLSIPSNGTIKTLFSSRRDTTGKTLHDMNDVDYKPAFGTSFFACGLTILSGATARDIAIFYSDTADGSSTPITFHNHETPGAETIYSLSWEPYEVPTGKYVNWKSSSTSGAPAYIIVFGYEVFT